MITRLYVDGVKVSVKGGLPLTIEAWIEPADPSVGLAESIDEWNITAIGQHVIGDGAPWLVRLLSLSDTAAIEKAIYEKRGHYFEEIV